MWRKLITEGKDKPAGRVGHQATVVGDKMYVFGGMTAVELNQKENSLTRPGSLMSCGSGMCWWCCGHWHACTQLLIIGDHACTGLHGVTAQSHTRDVDIPKRVAAFRADVTTISVFHDHCLALTTRGKVFSWGNGGDGRLGLGDYKDRTSPSLIEGLSQHTVVGVAAGTYIQLREKTKQNKKNSCFMC